MLKEIVIAIQSYNDARQFIKAHKLWKWIIIPGLIYTLLFLTGMYFFSQSATGVIDYLTMVTGVSEWIQQLASSWVGFLFALAGVILWLLLLLFYFSLFKYAWLIIGAPIFTYLSERTQAIMEEKEFSFNSRQLFRDITPALRVAGSNCLRQVGYFILLILLSVVPLIGMIAPVIALFMECYYYGYSMISYSLDRKSISREQSSLYIKEHKGLAVGNGLVFYIMHLVIFLAPAYAIIASTLSVYKVKPE
ncbi:MAG: hypothetical protein GC171_01530 [Terrimonas sp.]|nr:hypothetical protein [Terrimonas sp.]